MGPFRGLLVAAEGFLLGLEVVEGFVEFLPEVFLDSMLVCCVLAAWVLPFNPSLVFCSVVSPSALVGLLLLYVGQRLAAAFRSLGSSGTGVRWPWRGLVLSAVGHPLGPLMSPVVVSFRPFQLSRLLRSLSFFCVLVMSFLVVVL